MTNLAQVAYNAYGDDAHWKNYQDKPMPGWDDLPEAIRQHWKYAIIHVLDTINAESNYAHFRRTC